MKNLLIGEGAQGPRQPLRNRSHGPRRGIRNQAHSGTPARIGCRMIVGDTIDVKDCLFRIVKDFARARCERGR